MTTKLVIRLLDSANQLLGWTEHQAKARGDGKLRAQGQVRLVIEQAGSPQTLSVHWADLNVEVRTDVTAWLSVIVGQVLTVAEHDGPLITAGAMPGPLPAVTVRQAVSVNVPVGQMGATGARL